MELVFLWRFYSLKQKKKSHFPRYCMLHTPWFICVDAYNTKEGQGRHAFQCLYSFLENIKWTHDRVRLPLFHAILSEIIKMLTSCLCGKYNFIYIGQVLKINIFTNTVYRVRSQVFKLSQTHKKATYFRSGKKIKGKCQSRSLYNFLLFFGPDWHKLMRYGYTKPVSFDWTTLSDSFTVC